MSASTLTMNEGRIRNPVNPVELLTVPLARAIRQADVEPIALPLLLLVTSNAQRTGTLTLRMEGGGELPIPFVAGRPMLASAETEALIECFRKPTGTYRFESGEPAASARRLEHRAAPSWSASCSTVRTLATACSSPSVPSACSGSGRCNRHTLAW